MLSWVSNAYSIFSSEFEEPNNLILCVFRAINLEKQESWNRHINEKIVQLFSLQFILYPGILYTCIPETRVLAPYRIMKEERF
jgi:hypothetical protein